MLRCGVLADRFELVFLFCFGGLILGLRSGLAWPWPGGLGLGWAGMSKHDLWECSKLGSLWVSFFYIRVQYHIGDLKRGPII